jgi:hypothetical protein
MFSRVVAVTTKPGKVGELSKTIHDKILPILKNQPGFVDVVLLLSNAEPRPDPRPELLGNSARCRALDTRTISEDQRAHLPLGREHAGVPDLRC